MPASCAAVSSRRATSWARGRPRRDQEGHARQAPEADRRGRREEDPDPLPPGAVLRALLLRRAGDEVVPVDRAGARGATTILMQKLAKKHRMAMVVPVYEEEQTGIYYNTAAVIDADGKYLGKYRRPTSRMPSGLLGEVLLPPRQPRLPGLRDRVREDRRLHLLRPPLPGGRASAGARRGRDRLQPSATVAGLSEYLWELEQPAHAVANGYFVGAITGWARSAVEDREFYGKSYFCDPRGKIVARRRATATRWWWPTSTST